ncbi:DUF4365 domain-containing protein [Streptomyces griseoaurantiacus]|uniref:DUF4365 domain-containing protein n=1 Tax=Streptomyces griseoaurantiacus TaxID=68213 RepID=UPI003F1E3A6E
MRGDRTHAIEDWTKSRIPVIGVVYDPEMHACYWVNLTEYLRREMKRRSWREMESAI